MEAALADLIFEYEALMDTARSLCEKICVGRERCMKRCLERERKKISEQLERKYNIKVEVIKW